MQILLSRTQAGPGRTVKQELEEISPNHVQRKNLISVHVDPSFHAAPDEVGSISVYRLDMSSVRALRKRSRKEHFSW